MKISSILVLLLFSIMGYGQINLPITFDDPGTDYSLADFGGNSSAIIVDPTDPGNMVVQSVKTDVAELWAGTTAGEFGLVTPIPFTAVNTKMKVRVWSPDAGIQIRLKVEDAGDPTKSVETEATTTTAMDWEVLEFDFSNEAPGTATINLTYVYNKISIFFNFGITGMDAGEKTYFWDDVEFIGGGGGPAQIDLPVTFEEVNVDYTLTDFGGNVSAVVVDPTDPTNTVGQSIKTDVAELWAGTTMGTTGFASVIPFTATNTKMRVRVWSPDAGTPIRLKVEDANDPTKSVETETSTTVAMDWETLEFDFNNEVAGTAPLNMTYAYSKASIFFNFGTTGMDAGVKIYFWDDVEFVSGGGGLAQIDLPVTFEDANVDYTLTDFGGNASSIVEDPTDPTNTVGQSVKTDAAELWAGTTMGTTGFATVIPFTASNTTMSVRVWSPDAGTPIRLKVEDANDPTKSVETETLTTAAMSWETLEFNFSNEVAGTAPLNVTYSYSKASIFFNFGTTGADAGEKTYYWDDVEFIGGGGGPAQIDLPVTFEEADVDYTLTDFGGNASAVVEDPTDPTNTVGQTIKTDMAELWAGTTIGTDAGFASLIPFTVADTKMKVRVWSPDAGIPIRLKVEDANDPTKSVETEVLTTVAMDWETLEFDFSNEVAGTAPLNLTYAYSKASIFFNFGTTGMDAGEKTYYWDDVEFSGEGGGLAQIDLPVTFEEVNVDYSLTDFGGNASAVVEDPTDPTNTVGQTIKTDMAELWAGTTIGTDAGFASLIPFTGIATKMKVRVWSPDAGIPIRLKVEDANDPTKSVETEALTTVAMAWETLEFDFSNEAAGTAPLNLTYAYSKASIFFNFGTTGMDAGEKTYYWDDVEFGGGGSGLAQIDLPVTFEDPTVDYTLTDFGGNASSVVVDPTDPTNTVGETIKTNAAELWAGTTIGTASGFASLIPFTATETKMKVRVWSPDAGIPIRLKVEESGDPTKSVETEATTTVAMAWETLEFDFSNEAVGTAPIDLTYAYDKASIFFNFGTTGADAGEKTYYFDDVEFGARVTVVDIIVNSPDHETLETAVIAAELDDDLSGAGPFSVFAPTDAAFAALPAGTVADLLLDPTGVLAQILLYHVLGAEVYSSDLSDGQMAGTLQGEDITVTIDANNNVFINQAMVTVADLQADNGVVHVIDAVLLPPTFVGTQSLDASLYNIQVSPNPANTFINIEFPEILSEVVLVKLYDMNGRLVKTEKTSQQITQINTVDLNTGMYVLKMETGNATYFKKVMIVK